MRQRYHQASDMVLDAGTQMKGGASGEAYSLAFGSSGGGCGFSLVILPAIYPKYCALCTGRNCNKNL